MRLIVVGHAVSFRVCEDLRKEDQHWPTLFQAAIPGTVRLKYVGRSLSIYRHNVTPPMYIHLAYFPQVVIEFWGNFLWRDLNRFA